MKYPRIKKQLSDGYILAVLIVTVMFTMLAVTYITSLSLTTYNLATRDIYRANAQMTADAALDYALATLNTQGEGALSSSYTAEETFLNDGNTTTTYQYALLDGADTDRKIVSVIAQSKVGGETKITRRYELDVQRITNGVGITSVVSGVGDLNMNNNSRITGGDVVVNGRLLMSNNSQIGLSTTPLANKVNIRVAHNSCPIPADSTFPQLCGSGNGESISMNNNSVIYGDVQANNQTTSSRMYNPGLTANSGVPLAAFPNFDRATLTGYVDYAPNHPSIRCPNNNGNITWPNQKIRITGDFTSGNNCRVTILDDVWVTGKVDTGNQGRFIVSDTTTAKLGRRPYFIVDGQAGFKLSNNGVVTPNSSGDGIEVRTFYSRASCSPNCTTVTGPDLKNSLNDVTIDLGNNGNAPNSVFIAQWSRVRISNNGQLGAVAGQSVELSNQAVINFTASVPGSNNLTTTWAKRGYMRVYQ